MENPRYESDREMAESVALIPGSAEESPEPSKALPPEWTLWILPGHLYV